MWKEVDYRLLVDTEDGDNRLKNRHGTIPWLIHAVLLSLSLGFLISGLWVRHPSSTSRPGDAAPIYSPVLQTVRYEQVRLNGSFKYESIYKGSPTPELDQAWAKIVSGDILPGPLISISEEELVKIDQADDIDAVVKFPPEKGGGYVASIEVLHQLHCLNMLRQITYPEYYNRNSDPDSINRMHIDHCIDMLRQHLMCRGDTGIVTGRWVENYGHLYPYFSTLHTCRNFDAIYQWADERRVDVSHEELKQYRGNTSLKDIP